MMSDCACIYIDGVEGGQPLKQKVQKARKTHKCGECGKEILSGERYEYFFGIFDGDSFSHKTCMGCMIIRDHLFCESYAFGKIWDEIQQDDNVENIIKNCLSDLLIKLEGHDHIKEKLNGIIEDYKKDHVDEFCDCEKCEAYDPCYNHPLQELMPENVCGCKYCEVVKYCKGQQ